ncbi:hypothetical protein NFI96_002203 [Prochilodus magdalenae]|nr:hypothetical protein NFI96_002203 [Prochilodus magdalenae]
MFKDKVSLIRVMFPKFSIYIQAFMMEEQDEHCQSPTAVNVSDQTIRNRPHEGGLRARRPVVGPVLTGQHRRARLAFATEHQNWQICHSQSYDENPCNIRTSKSGGIYGVG